MTPACRFCYNYKPPGPIDTCCAPTICTTSTEIAIRASIPDVVNNSTQTSQQSLLLAKQRQYLQDVQAKKIAQLVLATQANQQKINKQIEGELAQLKAERYQPYQPYIYPTVPRSVMELQMATANVGNPMPPATIASCKGSQFVTT
jgi:hypothetical protein